MKTNVLFEHGKVKQFAQIGYASPTDPIEIVVEKIPSGCQIQFLRVFSDDSLQKTMQTCQNNASFSSVMRHEMLHKVCCDQVVYLDQERNSVFLDRAGFYIAAIVGDATGNVCLGEVVAYAYTHEAYKGVIDDSMRGCCGLPEADLQALKATPLPRYKVGETFSYNIRLINAGQSDASGALVRDFLPEEFEMTGTASVIYGGGAIGAATLTRSQLASWTITNMPVGGYADVTVTGKYSKHGAYLNTVCISPPDGVAERDPKNNCAEVLINIDELKTAIEITKTSTNTNPLVGDTGAYMLTITNTGIDPDTNVVLTDVLPVGLNYTEPFTVTNSGATGVPTTVTSAQLAAGVVIAETLPVGAVITVQIPYTVTEAAAGKTLANTAKIKGDLGEDDDTVIVSPSTPTVDLSVTKTSDKQSYSIGDVVTYTVSFANAGLSDANGAVIKDVIPASLTSVAIASSYSGGAGTGVPTQAQLATGWIIPTLPAGGVGVLTITGVTTVAGAISNQVSITAPSGRVDINNGNNNAIVVVTIKEHPFTKCNDDPLDPLADKIVTCDLLPNKCDGSKVSGSDTVFTVGSLKKCVGGLPVNLTCGDIVVTKADCDEILCQTAVRMTSPSALVGAGVCVDVQATGFDNGIAVLRGRDLSSELGTVAQGGSVGAHLTYTHTNNSTCPQLFVARLVANGNIARWAPVGTRISFVYNIGEVLNINMPTTASNPFLPNFQTMRQTIFAAASNTRGATAGINEYQESTVSGARLIKVLQPGESVTPIAQWWAVLYEDTQLPVLTPIHGHMGMEITVYENGAWL